MQLDLTGRLATGQAGLDVDLRDMRILQTGSGSYLYAATGQNGGVSAWNLDTGGALAGLADTAWFTVSGMATGALQTVSLNGVDHLILPGAGNSDLLGYALDPGGGIGALTQIAPGAGGRKSAMTSAALGDGATVLYMADAATGRIEAHVIGSGGQARGADGGAGQGVVTLSGTVSLQTAHVAGQDWLLAADAGTQGVSAFRIAPGGLLEAAGTLGAAEGLGVAQPTALCTVAAHGQTWVILAAAGSSSLSVMRLGADGSLRATDHLIDTLDTRFGAVQALEVIEVQGHVLVLAGGGDDGLSLFTLPLAALGHVIRDTASGNADLQGSAGADLILGGDGVDRLSGGAGDDVLVSGPGGGVLTGGAGRDIFVLRPTTGTLRITDYEPGLDRLDLGLFPMLRSPAQISVETTATGAELILRDTRILIDSADRSPLHVGNFWAGTSLGTPDRVLVLSPEQDDQPGPPEDIVRHGGAGDDHLHGGPGNDRLFGGEGNDRLWGKEGDDNLHGGPGNDTIYGEAGHDRIWGGAGHDRLYGGPGNDTIYGEAGDDRIWGKQGDDRLYGGPGNDMIYGEAGDDRVWGKQGDDRLYGGPGNDTIYGQAGHDHLHGGPGNDTIYGEAGNDVIFGGPGHDGLYGGPGNDTLYGEAGDDRIWGKEGDDHLYGGPGNDRLFGGAGHDRLWGRQDDDHLHGEAGNDMLFGGAGNDRLYGGPGDDEVFGGPGDDTIYGGPGDDILTGGPGRDAFVVHAHHGHDHITDFTPGIDRIHLSLGNTGLGDLGFSARGEDLEIDTGTGTIILTGLAPGDLAADDFLFF